ncbi:MAG: LysR family transcriptional regulator [Chloroflexi bacterium]|nr:LysR family transcriptional regulator [Chloroflexota bacterium]
MDEFGTLSVHLQQLAYLREVERTGTFTQAAQRLHMSQPALLQSLAELQRRVGLPLFEARGRRRILTEAGREAVRFATDVLGRTAEFCAWADAYRAGTQGTLTVGMIDAASLYALPGAVRTFRAAHPDVRLQLVVDTSGVLVERLRRYELDLAFVVSPVDGDLESVEIGREPLHIYTPPGVSPVASAGDAEWVLYPQGSHTRQQIDEGLARLGIVPRVALESHNPQVLRQMVELGLGWGVLPPAVVGEGPLIQREQVAERSLLGVRRAGRAEDPRVSAFLQVAMAATRLA